MIVGQLALDITGTSESRVVAWDFSQFPEIVAGDTVLSSPAPVIGYLPAAPALTIASITVSGTQVQAIVSIAGGVVGTQYLTSCRVQTATGRVLVNDIGEIQIIGPQTQR